LALPRIERYLPETLNELQVDNSWKKSTPNCSWLRDAAMIELLYASGLRISEAGNARLENFNSNSVWARDWQRKTRPVWCPSPKACEAWQHTSLPSDQNW